MTRNKAGACEAAPLRGSQIIETAPPPKKERLIPAGHGRKNILFVTNTDEYGGLEKHLFELVRRLNEPGVQISICNLGPDPYTEHLEENECTQIGVLCRTRPLSFWGWFQLFRDVRPDIVVFCSGWVWSFPGYAFVAAFLGGARRRFSIQHLFSPIMPRVRVPGRRSLRSVRERLFGRRTLGLLGSRVSSYLCHTTVCVSNAIRKSLLTDYRFSPNKTITIYNGVSVSKFAPSRIGTNTVRTRLGVAPDEFLLVCVARLSEVKRIDILLQAVARVLRDDIRCKCVIVGDGPLRQQLNDEAVALGLSGHVFFEGFHEDVRPYLHAGNAFVLTSRLEGLPLSVLEAMACGLPCVVTDVGGNAEAVRHQVHGLVVPPESADAVANAISYLATHPDERAQMSRMARARVCEAFDIEKSMAEVTRVILS